MTRRLQAANGMAIALLVALVAGAVATRNVLGWLLALHVLAAVLALRAARAGAGTTLRGWTLGANAWCVILDALLLAAFAYGLLRGLAAPSLKIAALATVPAALLALGAANMRAMAALNDAAARSTPDSAKP